MSKAIAARTRTTTLLLFAMSILARVALSQTSIPASKSPGELRKCLKEPSCQDALDAAYQLAKQHDFSFLISEYKISGKNNQSWIVQGIYASDIGRDDLAAISFIKAVAFPSEPRADLSDTHWYALQFLAETCDQRALNKLRVHGGDDRNVYGYHVSCGDWTKSLKTFGDCRYTAGREVLLNSLNSSCLDVVQAAGDSLSALYSGECLQRKTFPEVKRCYIHSWRNEPQ
jgi:hypothetical protein